MRNQSTLGALSIAATVAIAACHHGAGQPAAPRAPSPNDRTVSVGYGEQKASTIAGAVSTVNADTTQQTTSFEQLLSRVPGVQVSRGGGGITVRIRGTNTLMGDTEPLFVVDGVVFNGGANALVGAIPPGDVKRIEVLKDAGMTAIYGSRGANGVILVTTRRHEQ